MSCDWNIRCVTCGISTCFYNTNHCEDLMRCLIGHAGEIAGLVAMFRDPELRHEVDLMTSHGRVDVEWFAEHAGHDLRAIDEYGCLLGQCHGGYRLTCPACGLMVFCQREEGHGGDHAPAICRCRDDEARDDANSSPADGGPVPEVSEMRSAQKATI